MPRRWGKMMEIRRKWVEGRCLPLGGGPGLRQEGGKEEGGYMEVGVRTSIPCSYAAQGNVADRRRR